jgi:hypothetical protein
MASERLPVQMFSASAEYYDLVYAAFTPASTGPTVLDN